jgi:CRP-like cAMP-binding protein
MSLTDGAGGGWFAGLPATERAELHGRGAARRYRPGSTLFNEGDLSDWVVIVLEGRVKVSVTTADGKEVILAIRGPGELLGDLAAIDAYPRSATATAIDTVDCRIVSADELQLFLMARPKAAMAFLRSISRRLRDSDRRQVEFIALDSIGRVATRLVELAERYGVPGLDGTILIDIPLSQDELAGLTGTSREAVGKALHLFRRLGWIDTARRRVTVIALDRLRARAD